MKPTAPKGAPKGNKNALKHGIYSKHISIQDDLELSEMSNNNPTDEIAIARARIRMALDKQKETPTLEDWIKFETLIMNEIFGVANIVHSVAILGQDKRQSFVTIMEMIDVLNKEQNVK